MRLTYRKMNISFELVASELNSIVIEDSDLFFDFVMELSGQANRAMESFILTEDNGVIDYYKNVEIITSPLELEYNKKSVQKKLYDDIQSDMIISGAAEEISEIFGRLVDIMEKNNLFSDYNIDFSDNLGISDILKFLNVEFSKPEGYFAERFMEYSKIIHRFIGKRIFFLVNCDAYLKNEDYEHLKKWGNYYELIIVFVKNSQTYFKSCCNEYIIDKDLCFLH